MSTIHREPLFHCDRCGSESEMNNHLTVDVCIVNLLPMLQIEAINKDLCVICEGKLLDFLGEDTNNIEAIYDEPF